MATQVSLNDGAVASAGALAIQTNGTTQAVSISTGQVATLAQNPILTSGTANGVAYLNGSKVLTTGSALTFDGSTQFTVNGSTTSTALSIKNTVSEISLQSISNDGYINMTGTGGTIFRLGSGFTEGMRLTSTGLGIGTSSPADKLEVHSTITARASSGTSALRLRNTTTDMQWQSVAGTNAVSLFDSGAGLTRLTVDSAGNVTLQKNISVGGATVTTSGTGITFPATQSASTDANTLDDYEEGTWTPTQGAGLTVVGAFSSSGRYTKIGRQVFIEGVVTGGTSVAIPSVNAITISSLPFSQGFSRSPGLAGNEAISASAAFQVIGTNLYFMETMAATTNIRFSATYSV